MVSNSIEYEDINPQIFMESDNEEMINYVSNKLLTIEESFVQHFQARENKDFDDTFCNNNYLGENEDQKRMEDSRVFEYMEDMFREINSINDVLLKIEKSNLTKREKLQSLSEKYRALYEKYYSDKIQNQFLKEELEQRENQVNNLENIINNMENENLELRDKIDELLENEKRNQELYPLDSYTDKYSNDRYCDKPKAERILQERLVTLEDLNKTVIGENEVMLSQLESLKQSLHFKDDKIRETIFGFEAGCSKIKYLEQNNRQLALDKCYLQNELENIKKEMHIMCVSKLSHSRMQSSMKTLENFPRLDPGCSGSNFGPINDAK